MAQILDDNTVIPSYLGMRSSGHAEATGALTNTGLRVGEVRERILPTDPKSVSKRFIEYTVEVQHRDGYGPGTTARYQSCIVVNLFGGTADFFSYTLRAEDKNVGGRREADGIGVGSKVVLLCINGETSRALIIGGVRDPKLDTGADFDSLAGHHLLFQFNGIRLDINDDGELTLSFKGATKADGSLRDGVDANNSGAQVTLTKDGNLKLSHGDQALTLDHGSQSWILEADKDITQTAGQNWKAEAQQQATLTGQQGVDINTTGTCVVTAASTQIGGTDAVDALVKGTTWRLKEAERHLLMMNGLEGAIAALSTAATSLAAVASAHGFPVLGPVQAAPTLAAAAASMQLAATALQSVVSAIQSYESGSDPILSKKNTTD